MSNLKRICGTSIGASFKDATSCMLHVFNDKGDSILIKEYKYPPVEMMHIYARESEPLNEVVLGWLVVEMPHEIYDTLMEMHKEELEKMN